jgi:hypothetical protein
MKKITKTEERFNKFVEQIKIAKSDLDIALVGWDLVEAYMGFRSGKCAWQSKYIIEKIFKK